MQIAVAVHWLGNLDLSECGKACFGHFVSEVKVEGDIIERKSPAIREGLFERVISNVPVIRSPDSIKGWLEEVIADFVCSAETTVQIEDESFDHRKDSSLRSGRILANSLRMCVDIEGIAAEEADQGLVALVCKIDRKAGGRRDGGNDWNAGSERFLHNFK